MSTPCTMNIVDHQKNGALEADDANDQFLLCDEVWDMSPIMASSSSLSSSYNNDGSLFVHDHAPKFGNNRVDNYYMVHSITKQDCEHSFATWLSKESKFMTGLGYINFLESNTFVGACRFKAIQWFIHSQRRFNFCMGTLFKAVNHLDRFIETDPCNGWSYWMMELLSLASLSIAIKFGETCPPSLYEIQDGLESCFEASLIQKMELKILRSLGWELNSITPHSYVELITWELSSVMKPFVLDNLNSRLNDVLLASSLDVKSLVYRPSVLAMSGLRCILEDEECLSYITGFIPKDQEENLQSCYKMMQEILVRSRKPDTNGNPSSPDTVLIKEQVAIYEEQVDLSFIDGPNTLILSTNDLKRKREEDGHHCVTKFNKCVN